MTTPTPPVTAPALTFERFSELTTDFPPLGSWCKTCGAKRRRWEW